MKIKMGISIVLGLLMIGAVFTFTTTAELAENDHPGQIEFTKKVWDKEAGEWVDEIEAELGETLRFKLEVKYLMDEYYNENPLTLYDINITDGFSWEAYCFRYVEGSATTPPTEVITDYMLFWELDTVLGDNESFSIEFEFLIVDLDCEHLENINWAYVNANECGLYEQYGEDCAIINLKSGLEIEKKVKDPDTGEWIDELPQVILSENIFFQITATYYGCNTMKCMVIGDLLPDECFEYLTTTKVEVAGSVISDTDARYPEIFSDEDDTIIICDEEIKLSDIAGVVNDYVIFWDWRNSDFNLHNGESVILEFEVNITKYCDSLVTDWAVGVIWGCYLCDPCNYFVGCDDAKVKCSPPPTTFEKKVKDPDTGEWVEEISTFVDEKVTFKLELTYYGAKDLTDIRILDELPCVLAFADNVASSVNMSVEVSSDGKLIWFNMSEDTVKDGETLTVTFDALVTEVTGGCDDCKAINKATLYVYEKQDCQDVIVAEYSDTANVTVDYNCDPYVKYITGPTDGKTKESLEFKAKGKDQCDSQLLYWFDWGDGTNSGWVGPYPSDTEVTKANSWDTVGTYTVKVKVKDEHDAESDWSEPVLNVNISEGEPDIKIVFNTKFAFKKITVNVKNMLTTQLDDAFVEITVTGGFLKKMDSTINWTKNLTSGNNNFVFDKFKMLPMFGRLSIHVNVTIPGYTESFEATASAFKLGPFVKVKP